MLTINFNISCLFKISNQLQARKQTVYVGVTTRTISNEPHLQKVIVPNKTNVNAEKLNTDNRLDYLEFNQCDRSYHFDGNTRTVYMEITSIDYQKQMKEYVFFSHENKH